MLSCTIRDSMIVSMCSNRREQTYANHITHHSFVGGGSGAAFVNDPTSPYNGRQFNINSSKDDIAIVGELDFGVNWQVSSRWSTQLGYRAVAIAGMGLATNQIPHNFSDIGGVEDIDSNGHMILHGAYLNATFNY